MAQLTPTATASKNATTGTTCYLLPPDAFATGYSYWLRLLLLVFLLTPTAIKLAQTRTSVISKLFKGGFKALGT